MNTMRIRLLVDEIPTKQDALSTALIELGADIEVGSKFDDEEIAWGSDPFDILAHRQACGLDD